MKYILTEFFFFTGIAFWLVSSVITLLMLWWKIPQRKRRLFRDFLNIPHDIYWIIFRYTPKDCEEAIDNINKMIDWHRKNHTPVRLFISLCKWKLKRAKSINPKQ
jgi:hypothetical protein